MDFNIGIRLNQLLVLFDLLINNKSRDFTYLKSIYIKYVERFDETLSFLQSLRLLDLVNTQIICYPEFFEFLNTYTTSFDKEEKVKKFLSNLILDNTREGSRPYQQYISKFKIYNGMLIYSPSRKENIRSSGIRNLLMDLGLITLSESKHYYQLDNSLINQIDEKYSLLNPSAFRKIQMIKEEMGKKAEFWVLEDEMRRLSNFPELSKKISHVSKKSISMGYDILSFEIESVNLDNPIPRYIEVKAINIEYLQFFWSKNEIQKAKTLSNQYWLYLVYYQNLTKFIVTHVKRISDPYRNVFQNTNVWKKQIENYSFTQS